MHWFFAIYYFGGAVMIVPADSFEGCTRLWQSYNARVRDEPSRARGHYYVDCIEMTAPPRAKHDIYAAKPTKQRKQK